MPKSPTHIQKTVELFPELDLHSSKEEGNKSKRSKQIKNQPTSWHAILFKSSFKKPNVALPHFKTFSVSSLFSPIYSLEMSSSWVLMS